VIVRLKSIGNRSDVPYHSPIELSLEERLDRELG